MVFDTFLKQYQKTPVEEYANRVSSSPLVSVIVVTYQHINFIRQCLDGILMQEVDFEYEILLGEDDSTDGTREVCMEYAEKYPEKIRLFLHSRKNNIKIGGQPTGRFNFMYNLFQARGKYIALCEGDDYWADPLKLQKQVDFLENHLEYSCCFHVTEIMEQDNSTRRSHNLEKPSYLSIEDFFKGNPVGANTASVVFKRSKLWDGTRIPEYFKYVLVGDLFLWVELLKNGKGCVLPDIMGAYRRAGGVWSGNDMMTNLVSEYRILNELDIYLFKGTNHKLIEARDKAYQKLREAMKSHLVQIENLKSSFTFRLGQFIYAPILKLKRLLIR